jgi:hypothetical protein
MSERTREKGGSGVFSWRGGLGDRRGESWRSGLVLAKLGDGVSVLGLGMRGARGFGGTWVSRGAEMGVPTVRSRLHAQELDSGRGVKRARGQGRLRQWAAGVVWSRRA